MQIKFSDEFNDIAFRARNEALRTGQLGIGVDHLMLGILRHKNNDACRTLSELGIDLKEFKRYIDSRIFQERALTLHDQDAIRPTKAAASVVSIAAYEALKSESPEILSSHLLLAVSRSEGNASREFMASKSVDYNRLHERIRQSGRLKESTKIRTPRMEEAASALGEQLTNLFGSVKSKTNLYS